MKKTIFNVYVVMESQEQCERMKQLCIDNGLPIWNCKAGWEFINEFKCSFTYDELYDKEFFVFIGESNQLKNKTKVTESEFIELLKEYKNV